MPGWHPVLVLCKLAAQQVALSRLLIAYRRSEVTGESEASDIQARPGLSIVNLTGICHTDGFSDALAA